MIRALPNFLERIKIFEKSRNFHRFFTIGNPIENHDFSKIPNFKKIENLRFSIGFPIVKNR